MKSKKSSYHLMKYVVLFAIVSFLLPVHASAKVNGASIKLNKSKATIYTSGTKTIQLKATVRGTSKKVTWKSSNEKIAAVNSKGKVTAQKAGIATITAKANGKKAKCKIVVKNREANSGNNLLAKKAYSEYAKQNLLFKEEYPYGECTFYDINGDGISEMFFCYMSGVRSGFKIYTYKNNEIVHLKSVTGVSCIYYKRSKNQICILTSGGAADNCYTYYRLKGGKLSIINKYQSVSSSRLQKMVIKFYKNDKKIKRLKYIADTDMTNWKIIGRD